MAKPKKEEPKQKDVPRGIDPMASKPTILPVIDPCKHCGHSRGIHYEGKHQQCNTRGCLCEAYQWS